jgi:DMSO/TMAO reductase YedYZ molybdopterin-dependent catalytic subunit
LTGRRRCRNVKRMSDGKPKPLPERKENFARKQARQGKGLAGGRSPGGSGPPNRHGMPRLPPGQRQVPGWPVLDLGDQPRIALPDWQLTIDGLVEHPLTFSWDEFMQLPQTDDSSDFHCVTTWSRMDLRWRGVRFADLMARAVPAQKARYLVTTGHDVDGSSGEPYTTNLSLDEAMKPDVLLVHTVEGAPLPVEHGGPCRMITPQLYAWKGAKWIRRITLTRDNQPGFWERRGYSNSALPWFDDRYNRG